MRISKKTILSLWSVSLLSLAAASPSWAEITVDNPKSYETSSHASVGAAFMTIKNSGDQAETIIAASSDICDHVEIHTMSENENGLMQMRKLEGGLEIPANGAVELAPMGYHFMLIGLKNPLEVGSSIHLTLETKNNQKIEITVPVDTRNKSKKN
ncbi:MAG TPA: copper chaperone PCu(A)C [Alphaproteobacteria bacterium]|mgnify:CR=1 FL=1|nr:copper chaperone PCu(A)C [Alphaproteobacteria bacterium]HOO50596.1 copper chaperone PCu(A)C [Alphaproteobacteria bacterium]